MKLEFTKMHGLGNDFMVVDGITQTPGFNRDVIQRLADRHKGIGFDQLLIVEPPMDPETDFHFRIYNADGSEAEQCGNGMRCLARFVRDRGLTWKNRIMATTMSGKVKMTLEKSGLISVQMGSPRFEPETIPLNKDSRQNIYQLHAGDETFEVASLSMGNPHALVFVEDVNKAEVERLGATIGRHPDFPNQTNVGFIQVVDQGHIRLRVFERGSGETLACGSGACAAMVAARVNGHVKDNIRVDLPGGHLFIRWSGGNKSVQMTGPATIVYKGQLHL